MNYQKTKTIQKHSINKNLLLLGLLAFTLVLQSCGGGKSGNKSDSKGTENTNVHNKELSMLLGEWPMTSKMPMTCETFMKGVGEAAKMRGDNLIEVKIASGKEEKNKVKTLPLPKEMKLVDAGTNKTDKVGYFKALHSELVQSKGMMKMEKVKDNPAITGLFEKVLKGFSGEDKEWKTKDHQNKNAKIYFLYLMLRLKEKVQAATSDQMVKEAVDEFMQEFAKIKHDGPGVLVQVDKAGNVKFMDVNFPKGKKDKRGNEKTKKFTLTKDLCEVIQAQVVAPIEKCRENMMNMMKM